jgi:hypothetical protein
MTELQQLALDAIHNLGPMTAQELGTACLCGRYIHSTIDSLIKRGMIAGDETCLSLTPSGRAQARFIP